MPLSENAKTVLGRRYVAKDVEGNPIEKPEEVFGRVASSIAKADLSFEEEKENIGTTEVQFHDMMENLNFLPNSPTLMNAGRPLGQLSACFVLPIEDSMEGIFGSIKDAALIHKSGGGTGFSFSRLRQSGSSVKSTGGVASGPVSFMKVFNAATEAVKQGGTRRGANMGILRIDHPDILDFIDCKQNNEEITNFNISIGITEAFMEAAQKRENYDLVDPKSKEIVNRLNAGEVFDKIVNAAWKNGEPGIVFLDRINKENITPLLGDIESTNPCGEQPLLPYEACNLGSINLANMVLQINGVNEVDWRKLEDTVKTAVHFLDNVIEINNYPLPEIDKMTRATRKIGLGVMGWADMLLQLKIPYNSAQAQNLAEAVMKHINICGTKESIRLSEIRGSFPEFDDSIYKNGFKKEIAGHIIDKVRNATITTIAPTGTLSIIANCSGGVEPIFAYAFYRNVMDGTKLVEINPYLEKELKERGLHSAELMEKIINSGSLAKIHEIPDDIKKVFVCSHDISPEDHLKMQAAFQKYTDNAVSKTVNFPNSATKEQVKEVYLQAYKTGCKGVTIYRDGSRDGQVLNIGDGKEKKFEEIIIEPEIAGPNSLLPRPRPSVTSGLTEKVKIGCGNLYVTVNYDEMGICEIFTNTGRAGGCASQSEASARLISIALRSGVNLEAIIEQLKGIRCSSCIRRKDVNVTSCPDAIARTIEKVVKQQNFDTNIFIKPIEIKTMEVKQERTGTHCPECQAFMENESGCVICKNCGYSKCG